MLAPVNVLGIRSSRTMGKKTTASTIPHDVAGRKTLLDADPHFRSEILR